MTEHSALAEGQHGRHPSPLIADVGVADGVDTAMNAVEMARGEPALDPARIDPANVQLLR
jgi:hypothetical protein